MKQIIIFMCGLTLIVLGAAVFIGMGTRPIDQNLNYNVYLIEAEHGSLLLHSKAQKLSLITNGANTIMFNWVDSSTTTMIPIYDSDVHKGTLNPVLPQDTIDANFKTGNYFILVTPDDEGDIPPDSGVSYIIVRNRGKVIASFSGVLQSGYTRAWGVDWNISWSSPKGTSYLRFPPGNFGIQVEVTNSNKLWR